MSSTDGQVDLGTFLADGKAFLDVAVPLRKTESKFVWGEGSDVLTKIAVKSREKELVDLAAVRDYCEKRFDAGFGWIQLCRIL